MRYLIASLVTASALAAGGCLTPRPPAGDGKTDRTAARPASAPDAPPATGGKADADLPAAVAAQACLKTGEEMEARGYDAEAAAQYERARQLDPKLARVARRLAVIYARTGDSPRATAEGEKALALAPTDPDLLNDLGYAESSRGSWAAAEKHLSEAVRAKPDYARAWVNLGVVYAKTGRTDESRAAFARVLTPAQAEYNLGVVLAGSGRTDEAKACGRAALALDPQLAAARDMLDRLDRPAPGVAPAAGH